MNRLALCLGGTFSLILGQAPIAFAASSIDLAVHGSITPSACTRLLGDAGVIDFGKIAARDLKPQAFTRLRDATLPLGVTCEGLTLFALKLTDNRPGSSASAPLGFGLGLTPGSEKIGVFNVVLHTPTADNAPITQLQSLNEGQSWVVVEDGVALPALRLAAFGNASSGAWAPAPIRALRVQMQVSTSIAPAQGLTLDREVPLDGSATLDLLYL